MIESKGSYRCMRIVKVQTENSRTKTFIFNEAVTCKPGQFVMVWLPRVNEKPFSVVQADPFALTVVSVGTFSAAVNALQPGDRVWIRGPLGNGFKIRGDHLLLVGGGYGAAPLYFLAKEALKMGKTLSVCLGAKSVEELLFAKQLRELGCGIEISTEDGSTGRKGLVTDLVRSIILNECIDAIYACGPVKLLEVLEKIAGESGVSCQLSWESHMRCGIGLCGSCEVKRPQPDGSLISWLTCSEGPVWSSENKKEPLE